jgi:hypothetical protein
MNGRGSCSNRSSRSQRRSPSSPQMLSALLRLAQGTASILPRRQSGSFIAINRSPIVSMARTGAGTPVGVATTTGALALLLTPRAPRRVVAPPSCVNAASWPTATIKLGPEQLRTTPSGTFSASRNGLPRFRRELPSTSTRKATRHACECVRIAYLTAIDLIKQVVASRNIPRTVLIISSGVLVARAPPRVTIGAIVCEAVSLNALQRCSRLHPTSTDTAAVNPAR